MSNSFDHSNICAFVCPYGNAANVVEPFVRSLDLGPDIDWGYRAGCTVMYIKGRGHSSAVLNHYEGLLRSKGIATWGGGYQ